MITYCGSVGSRPIRSSAAPIAIEPSSVAGYPARPPPSLPNGVRTAATMTERDIELSVPFGRPPMTPTAHIPTDLLTPLGAYLRLRESGTASYLLESVEHGRLGRHSFLGAGSRLVS